MRLILDASVSLYVLYLLASYFCLGYSCPYYENVQYAK